MLSNVHQVSGGRSAVLSLCQIICICATWVRVASALPQALAGQPPPTTLPTGPIALIPSAPKTPVLVSAPVLAPRLAAGLILSAPPSSITPTIAPQLGIIGSGPIGSAPVPAATSSPPARPGLIQSGAVSSEQIISTPGSIPSVSSPLLPSLPSPETSSQSGSSPPSLFPSSTASTTVDLYATITAAPSNVDPTAMQSTEQGLKPIPPETTAPGSPNGHHEIEEPGFVATKPCPGCSPVVEIPATGWDNSPAAEFQSTEPPPKATVTAGSSNIIITKEPTGGNFVVGGTTTVAPGQTIIVDNTPIAIQTSNGKTEVVIGTATIPFNAPGPQASEPQVTDSPLLPVLSIGQERVTANSDSQYIISGQTLVAGGPAITVSGTVVSLLPFATAVVVNGKTTTLAQRYGAIYTTTEAPVLTFKGRVYTANRAGFFTLAPGTTLVPGGKAIVIDGTTISLEHAGTAVVIQGQTSLLEPATTVVTLTREAGGNMNGDSEFTSDARLLLKPTTKSTSAVDRLSVPSLALLTTGWLERVFLLVCIGLGWLSVCL